MPTKISKLKKYFYTVININYVNIKELLPNVLHYWNTLWKIRNSTKLPVIILGNNYGVTT